MDTIPGYHITKVIDDGATSVVYYGIQQEDNQTVLLKTLKAEYPSLKDCGRLKHEYVITSTLDIDGILKPYRLEKYRQSLILVLEGFSDISLKEFIVDRKLDLTAFLEIAIQLAEILGLLHQKNITHKNIKPHNVLIHTTTKQVKMTDLGLASRLSQENQMIRHPNLLEGTLAYMSPEQTGRMNRAIDYRTDFYSLGVVFYEMLTGEVPFLTTDPLELMHCHIAKKPVPPEALNPEIPQAVSDIVMKLLAKTVEDRYKSAYGLKADLERCLTDWQGVGTIAPFVPGRDEVSDRFHMPHKLYGREAEVAALLAAFERVSQGTAELMLVSGFSGIGKSTLVNEMHKPVVQQRGYFVAGKFDQLQRDLPYSALIQALRALVRQLLTEGEDHIAAWRARLLDALGLVGQIIIEVIPEAELIIGAQPPVPQLGLTESQNRFQLVFQAFMSVFAQKTHPLVIFMDDVQWADAASLHLIRHLITEPHSQYLLMIGAYRDNEVSPTHPLLLTLEEIEKGQGTVSRISLRPLSMPDLNRWLGDTFSSKDAQVQPLTALVFSKTGGNPFFVIEFLQALCQEKLVVFDSHQGAWRWDIEHIQARQMTDNVVEFMASKIQKLDVATQEVLQFAACIGHQFDLKTLAIVCEQSPGDTAAALWQAVQEGLILPVDETYKFLHPGDVHDSVMPQATLEELAVAYTFAHDRVQQAVYSLILEAQKKTTHLKVGRLLRQHLDAEEMAGEIFEIVNHLNLGADLITDQTEREELARLNLIAGRQARAAVAYESAYHFFVRGVALMEEASWQQRYELTLALYMEAAEMAYRHGNFEHMERLAGVVLGKARVLLDTVKVYEIKIRACMAQNKLMEAVHMALSTLALLGVKLPAQPRKSHMFLGLLQVKLALRGRRIEALLTLPKMTDPHKLAAMRILTSVGSAVYVAAPDLMALMAMHGVLLSVRYGNTLASAEVYTAYGSILCGVVGDIESGYQFGKLALELAEQFNAASVPMLYMRVGVLINHWKTHLEEALHLLLEGYQRGLEAGALVSTAWNAYGHASTSYLVGRELPETAQEMATYEEVIARLKQTFVLHAHTIYRQAVLNLLGQADNPCRLIGTCYNEARMLPLHLKTHHKHAVYLVYFNKLLLNYLFQEYPQALEYVAHLEAEEYEGISRAAPICAIFHFYASLTRLAIYPSAHQSLQKRLLKKVAGYQKKMHKWAQHAPMNHLHKYHLVEAERARVLGQDLKAMASYERAISGARAHKYLNEEALANELAAKFYLGRGQAQMAKAYMLEARYVYLRWGALAKVQALEAQYPQLLAPTSTTRELAAVATRTTTSSDASQLDLTTVTKAAQAIAGEIVLEKLLARLMHIVIENAGAQKGCLILAQDGNLVIEATGEIEQDNVRVLQSMPVETQHALPVAVIHYVARTKEPVVLSDATHGGMFTMDPYIATQQVKSILCTPLLNQGNLIGMLYLENNLTLGAFTPERLEVLQILASQAAVSIRHAQLYRDQVQLATRLEDLVAERTAALRQSLQHLTETQEQLIQAEKMASLGRLTAGIAHEIRNPLNFINNFSALTVELTAELSTALAAHQEKRVAEVLEALDEILANLKLNAQKIAEHGQRADGIVRSMLWHSSSTPGQREATDVHALLEQALTLAYHSMRAQAANFHVTIEREYDVTIGNVDMVPQSMSRVFLNLLSNAFYAVHAKQQSAPGPFVPTVSVRTQHLGETVEMRVQDNGHGIPQEIRAKIFEPFFTTKPPGTGTGLGLALSYDIVVQEHQGRLMVESKAGYGATFIIILPTSRVAKTEGDGVSGQSLCSVRYAHAKG